jgi:carbon monoxide dehydrogenase subunit G
VAARQKIRLWKFRLLKLKSVSGFRNAFLKMYVLILTYSIKKPISQVYACLADVQQFVTVHPVIYKAEKVNEDEYVFYEQIKFLLIPFHVSYKVSLLDCKPNETVKMISQVQKGVHLQLTFLLKPLGEETIVTEEIAIKSFIITRLIFQGILKRVHKKLFLNIEKSTL